MIRKFAYQREAFDRVTNIEDKYLKAGEALQELMNEIMNGISRVEQIRFSDDTIVIHLGGKSPVRQRRAYFVGDWNDMAGYAKFAAYIAEVLFRSTDGPPYSYLTFGGLLREIDRETTRVVFGQDFARWYKNSNPAYVLLRAFALRLGHISGDQIVAVEAMNLETAASAFALVLDGACSLDEALALAK